MHTSGKLYTIFFTCTKPYMLADVFETLNVLKMFVKSFLVSFMPDEEYNIFLGQKPADNCWENLMTGGISLAVLKRQ